MTSIDIYNRLKTDPSFQIASIVANNPDAVLGNLQLQNMAVESTQTAIDVIVDLVNNGQKEVAESILMVDWIPENASSEFNQAVTALKAETQGNNGGDSVSAASWIGPVLSIVGGLALTAGSMLGGGGFGLPGQGGQAQLTPEEQAAIAEAERKKRNWAIAGWIGGGIAFILIIWGIIKLAQNSGKAK